MSNELSVPSANYEYNVAIKSLVDSMFQHEDEGKIDKERYNVDYQISTRERFTGERYRFVLSRALPEDIKFEPAEKKDEEYNDIQNVAIDPTLIGPLELRAIELLTTVQYTIILFTGEIGSGKTALCKYIKNYIDGHFIHEKCKDYSKCAYHHHIFEHIDFNSIGQSDNINKFEDDVNQEIVSCLENRLQDVLLESEVKNPLLDIIFGEDETNLKKYTTSYRRKWLKKKSTIYAMDNDDFVIDFFDWISTTFQGDRKKIPIYQALLQFIVSQYASRMKGCFILCVDNIDQLETKEQYLVLEKIMKLVEKTGVKVFIPIRLVNLGKIAGNGSFSYVLLDQCLLFENAGVLPVSLIIRRMENFIESNIYQNLSVNVDSEYLKHFLNRMKRVQSFLADTNDSRLASAINALSSNSLRRGLYLANRLFVNNYIHYSNHLMNQDELIGALLVGDSPDGKMQESDQMVTNLFADDKMNNTMMKLRILQLLRTSFNTNHVVRLKDIMSQMPSFCGCFEEVYESLRHALNDMIKYHNKLIVIDGVEYYDTQDALLNSQDDYVQITPTGRGYIDWLCESLQYVQSCFAAIEWTEQPLVRHAWGMSEFTEPLMVIGSDTDLKKRMTKTIQKESYKVFLKSISVPDNQSYLEEYSALKSHSMYDRFEFIRKGAQLMLHQDVYETLTYNQYSIPCHYSHKWVPNQLIMTELIQKMAQSILKIVSHHKYNRVKETLQDWEELLLISAFWEYALFNNSDVELNNIIDSYTQAIAKA